MQEVLQEDAAAPMAEVQVVLVASPRGSDV